MTDHAKTYVQDSDLLPPGDALAAIIKRASAASGEVAESVVRAIQVEYADKVHARNAEGLTKLASDISSTAFLEGFVKQCCEAGLTEIQTLRLASGFPAIVALAKRPDFVRGVHSQLK